MDGYFEPPQKEKSVQKGEYLHSNAMMMDLDSYFLLDFAISWYPA